MAEAGTGAIGRPHIARALIAGGWARDSREAFDRYLGFRKPAFVPKHTLGLADAIRLVHAAGGIAILAHPGGAGVRAWLETLAAADLVLCEDTRHSATLLDHYGIRTPRQPLHAPTCTSLQSPSPKQSAKRRPSRTSR